MPRRVLVRFDLAVLGVFVACSSPSNGRDGGTNLGFQLPDSGYIWDGGTSGEEAGLRDSGPFACDPPCSGALVCSCLDTQPATCGCHPRQAYGAACDLEVPASCEDGFECAPARTISGYRSICTDGRPGTPCSHIHETCKTSAGCVCQMTPVGEGCVCMGTPWPTSDR